MTSTLGERGGKTKTMKLWEGRKKEERKGGKS
jgi:hypothetical protein